MVLDTHGTNQSQATGYRGGWCDIHLLPYLIEEESSSVLILLEKMLSH